MDRKHDMAKQADDVEAIITDVFQVSGIKLTADDPVIAILLVQEAYLQRFESGDLHDQ